MNESSNLGDGFAAGLDPEQARFLQQVAENEHEAAALSGSN